MLLNFKAKKKNYYISYAMFLSSSAEKSNSMIDRLLHIKSAYFYLYYLILNSLDKKDLSKKWGQTGGSLRFINQRSPIKINVDLLIESFQKSIEFNAKDQGRNSNIQKSISNLGWQLLYKKEYDSARDEFIKSQEGNNYSLTGLGEISLRKGDIDKAKDYFIKAGKVVVQQNKKNQLQHLENIGNKLIELGALNDAVYFYKQLGMITTGRKKLFIEAKIQILKDRSL